MINALQIIAHLPYFNIMMPSNAAFFFNFVIDLSEFDIIPTDFIFEWLGFGSSEVDYEEGTSPKDLFARSLQETEETEQKVTKGKSNIFKELGTVFLALLVGGILLLVFILLMLLRRSFSLCRRVINHLLDKIKEKLFWNSTLTYF